MFTMPVVRSGAFVADGVFWIAVKLLLGVGATQATSTASLNTDGTVDINGSLDDRNWYDPTTVGIGSSYWVRATLLTGDMPSGSALNTWLQLNSVRSWSLTTTGTAVVRTKLCQLKLEFAADSGGALIVGTDTLEIEATVDNS